MAKYIEDGTYEATGLAASVYRKDNGNVILQTEWAIPSLNKTIRNWDCLIIGNTGEIREKQMANVRKWATGWDGTSFSWFPNNIAGLRVELVIENQPKTPPEYDENGNVKTYSSVKWVNPVGGGSGQKEMEADESAALDRIFAAKLRANAGARPVGGVAGVAKPATPAAPKPAPATPAAPTLPGMAAAPATPPVAPSTQAEVWERFCKLCNENEIKTDEERRKYFLSLVSDIGKQTDYADWSGEDWGRLLVAVNEWDGMPF